LNSARRRNGLGWCSTASAAAGASLAATALRNGSALDEAALALRCRAGSLLAGGVRCCLLLNCLHGCAPWFNLSVLLLETELCEKGRNAIWIYLTALPNGAQITYTTQDAHLVTALHQWFGAQLSDHGHDTMSQ
jgi:hypothetical protein